MYSVLQRTGAVISFFTSCLFVVLPLIALLNWVIKTGNPSITLVIDNVANRLGVEDYFMNKKVMLTDVRFDLDADFRNLFHWNVKQLFLYMSLEYEGENYQRNQVVFWDKIIRARDNKRISLTGAKAKYPITDFDDKLPGKKAIVKLYWNTVPHVGLLFDTQQGSVTLRVPDIGQKFERVN